jgi:hypothetical protein
MRHPIRASALLIVLIGVAASRGTASAQDRAGEPTLSTLPLAGGLAAWREAVGDSTPTAPAQFFVDVIRRSFQTPVSVRGMRREVVIRPILEHLNRAAKAGPARTSDSIPLPLTADLWVRSLLEAGARTETLAADILRSPAASLMYCGLLSLDDATRRWLGAHPEVLADIASRQPAHFLIAAPGLRVRDNVMQLPGGPAAHAAWEAAVGKSRNDPAAFIKAVVLRHDVSLAYLLGSAAQLTPQQTRLMLSLDGSEQVRATAIKRLADVFGRVAAGWEVADKPFWRPTLDPARLVADLRTADDGTPNLPGTTAFWTAAFSSDAIHPTDSLASLAAGPPVDFSWLCQQFFNGGQTLSRPPYQLVLFASRRIPAVTAGNVRAALGALRATSQFPALAGTLERAHISMLSAYDEAAQRARALAAMTDHPHAQLALAQFQGGVAIVARAATRGSLTPEDAGRLVSTLSALATDERGDYGGRVAEWLGDHLLSDRERQAQAADLLGDALGGGSARDAQLLWLLSGATSDRGTTLDWEGTKYRVSFSSAEALRLRQVLGAAFLPYLTAADTMVRAAKTFESATLTRQALAATGDAVAAAGDAVRCTEKDEWESLVLADRCREALAPVARAAKSGDTRHAPRLAPRLRLLADSLAARGLLVFAYAASMGQPDNAVISPLDAASRHVFGLELPGVGRAGAWRWPSAGSDRVRDWHLTGSALGLDVALAQYSLVRITNRPPPTRPSINDEDRIVLTESVVLMEPDLLTADDHAAIVNALKRGRERATQLRGTADADALAAAIHMAPLRRSLFAWTAGADHRAAVAMLSLSEIFTAGLDGAQPSRFDAWGVSGEPRLGCHCLQIPAAAFDAYAGRWFSGLLATGFTDLNLRLAELLDQLKMPGALLAPILASATWDFLMNVRINDYDDVPAWVSFVSAIGVDRVEQYLALLTTDGPLVPLTDGSQTR